MIDDEVTTNEEETFQELSPEPEVTEETPSDPVEVVTVDELLERLTTSESVEEDTAEEPESDVEAAVEPVEVVGMDQLLNLTGTIQKTVDHPLMTTPFSDYTVTEGLLLFLLLSAFAAACVRLLKGGFAWLR